jgi:hypothetical protein
MDVEITRKPGYLHVSVSERGGTDDARELLQKVMAAIEGDHRRLLINVRRSQAIFDVGQYGLSDALMRAAGVPGLKVALVADTEELFASYEYIERLAARRNLAAKAFRSDAEAVEWLLNGAPPLPAGRR